MSAGNGAGRSGGTVVASLVVFIIGVAVVIGVMAFAAALWSI